MADANAKQVEIAQKVKPTGQAEKTLRIELLMRTIPLAATLVMFLVADILIATAVDVRGDEQGGIVLGLTFAQVVLLAVWTALGPARLITRTMTGFCGTILVALALVACVSSGGGGGEGWLFFVISVVQWIVIQIPLWGFRLFGWRLCWPGEQITGASRRDMQFGIGQMMVWTALVGVTFGIGRLLMPDDLGRSTSSPPHALAIVTILTVYNCLLAWPVVWSTLAPRWWWLWLIASALCCVGLTAAEVFTFHQAMAMGRGGEEEIFWIMNTLQVAAASVALLALRAAGFRLTGITGQALTSKLR